MVHETTIVLIASFDDFKVLPSTGIHCTRVILMFFIIVICRLRRDGVILSRDGPHENVLKFKPPMCFTTEDADEVCDKIDALLTDMENRLSVCMYDYNYAPTIHQPTTYMVELESNPFVTYI